jgi:translation initiation factor IF-3
MNIVGTINKVFQVETKGSFKSRKVWVDVSESYKDKDGQIQSKTEQYELQISGEKAETFTLNAGAIVEFSVNLRGREWTSPTNEVKRFMSIDAWKWDVQADAPQQQAQAPQTQAPQATTGEDDLPF